MASKDVNAKGAKTEPPVERQTAHHLLNRCHDCKLQACFLLPMYAWQTHVRACSSRQTGAKIKERDQVLPRLDSSFKPGDCWAPARTLLCSAAVLYMCPLFRGACSMFSVRSHVSFGRHAAKAQCRAGDDILRRRY